MGSGTVQEMSEWVEYMTFDGVSPMADLRAENGHEKPWTVDFFGIGNENWGCGGNMNPEFYGNMYRRYQTFVRDYDGNKKIRKIACGANSDDYEWTQEVRKHAPADSHSSWQMDGLVASLLYGAGKPGITREVQRSLRKKTGIRP